MENADQIRASIIGVLIKDARIHSGRSIEESAAVMGMDVEAFEKIEKGEVFADMPLLEALALYLNVPFERFWGDQTMGGYPVKNFPELIAQRRQSIGSQVKRLREEKEMSAEEMAKRLELETAELDAIEAGERALSISEAEKIARTLSLSIRDLQEQSSESPLYTHEERQKLIKQIREMPEDVRAFIVKSVNQPYLKMAMKLSEMEVNRMRDFAADILEITL